MERVLDPELRRFTLEYLSKRYINESRRDELHLSDLIYCLTKTYYEKFDPLPPSEEELMLWSVGLGLQRVLVDNEAEPVEKDLIICSPDFITHRGVYAELKTTRKSSVQKLASGELVPSEFPDSWVEQMMGYCCVTNSTEYSLMVLHLRGDHRKKFMDLATWRVKFTQEELDTFWTYILDRRNTFGRYIGGSEVPTAYTYNKEWECVNCRYALRCQVASRAYNV